MGRSVRDAKPLRDGTFVIISLDPIASVAALDVQAAQEASLIKSGKYLALLKNATYFTHDFTSDTKTSTVELLLVGLGLPPAPASWASIPIFPAPSHPETGRPAVHTTLPLPWPDCHVYSMAEHTAIVSRIHTHPEPGPSLLDDHDRIEVYVMAGSDSRRFWRLQPRTLRMRTPLFERPDGSEEPMEIPAPAYASDSDFYVFLPSPPKLRMPEMRLHVELWVGLDGVTDLAHPDTFAGDVERLREIEQDFKIRFFDEHLNKPATSKWVESFSAANDPISEDNCEGQLEYDELGPEDALEHVMERASHIRARAACLFPAFFVAPGNEDSGRSPVTSCTTSQSESIGEVSSIDSSFASRVQRAGPRSFLLRPWYPLLDVVSKCAQLLSLSLPVDPPTNE